MGRSPCCSKVGIHRGQWTSREDSLLSSYIQTHGEGNWKSLPKKAGLLRCGKSCRLRWMNYLRPDIKRGNITQEEEDLIIRLRSLLGNRWSLIAGRLPGRTDNEIKNYWNSHLSKKLKKQGFVIPEQSSPPRRGPRSSRDRKTPTDHHDSTCRPVGDHEIFAPKPIRITATKFATGATPTCSGDSDGDAAGNPKAVDQICESSDSLGVDFDLDSADWDIHFRDQPVFDSLFHEYSLLLNSDADQDLHFMDPFSLMDPLSDSLTGPLIRSTDFMSPNLYVSRVR